MSCAHCGGCGSKVPKEPYDVVDLPGRPGSRAELPYKAAVYGSQKDAPVLLLHDMNGPGAASLCLAQHISDKGFRVYMPNLFPGEGLTLGKKGILKARRYLKSNPDWQVDSKDDAGLILEDLRCMVREVSRLNGGRQVAVVGNCLLGIHPLALLDEPCVSKAVLCQPATPVKSDLSVLLRQQQPDDVKTALGLSEADVARAMKALCGPSAKRIAAFHYEYDPLAPMERIDELHRRLKAEALHGRMQTFVLRYADYRSLPVPGWWTEHGFSTVKRGALNPHSTIISAKADEDLCWFRQKLIQFLQQP